MAVLSDLAESDPKLETMEIFLAKLKNVKTREQKMLRVLNKWI